MMRHWWLLSGRLRFFQNNLHLNPVSSTPFRCLLSSSLLSHNGAGGDGIPTEGLLNSVFSKLNMAVTVPLPDSPFLSGYSEAELEATVRFLREIGGNEGTLQNIARFKPLLLTKDLSKDLLPTLHCLESIGLDRLIMCSVLGRMSFDEIDWLVKGGLVEMVKILFSLEFTAEDIATLISVAFRDIRVLKAVMGMPEEKLSLVLKYLGSQGLDARQCRILISNIPIILSFSIGEHDSGIESLVRTIDYLRSLIKEEEDISKLIKRNFGFILKQSRSLQGMTEFLESLGINRGSAAKLLLSDISLLELGEGRLRECHEALMEAGLSNGKDLVWHLLQGGHWLFRRKDVRKRLSQFLAFLGSVGMEGEEEMRKAILAANPSLLGQSLEEFINRVSLLECAGLKADPSLLYKTVSELTIHLSSKDVENYLDFLTGLGFKGSVAYPLLSNAPGIWQTPLPELQRKTAFLIHQMSPRWHLEDLCECPSFLTCDLDQRIMPRYHLIDWLMLTIPDMLKPPLSTFAEMPDEEFVKKYVEPYGEEACHIYYKPRDY